MYKKITSTAIGQNIKVGSMLVMYYGPDEQASKNIRRDLTEHYQVTNFNDDKKFELSIPDDEIPDGPIYVNGVPITGIVNNEPVCVRSVPEFIEDDCWWLLDQE